MEPRYDRRTWFPDTKPKCSKKILDRLFDEHAEPYLLKFLIYRTGDRALVQDLVADTFERALRKRSLFDRARWGTESACLIAKDRPTTFCDGAGSAEVEGTRVPVVARPGARRRATVGARLRLRGACDGHGAGAGDDLKLRGARGRRAAVRRGSDASEMAKVLGEPLTTVEGRVYRALRKLRAELD